MSVAHSRAGLSNSYWLKSTPVFHLAPTPGIARPNISNFWSQPPIRAGPPLWASPGQGGWGERGVWLPPWRRRGARVHLGFVFGFQMNEHIPVQSHTTTLYPTPSLSGRSPANFFRSLVHLAIVPHYFCRCAVCTRLLQLLSDFQ